MFDGHCVCGAAGDSPYGWIIDMQLSSDPQGIKETFLVKNKDPIFPIWFQSFWDDLEMCEIMGY